FTDAGLPHSHDVAGGSNVGARVAFHQKQISALSGRDFTSVSQSKSLGRIGRGRFQGFSGRKTSLNQQRKFTMHAGSMFGAGVGSIGTCKNRDMRLLKLMDRLRRSGTRQMRPGREDGLQVLQVAGGESGG